MYDKEQIETDRTFETLINGEPDSAITTMDKAMGDLEYILTSRYVGAKGIADSYPYDATAQLTKEWEFEGQPATVSGFIWVAPTGREDESTPPKLPKVFGSVLDRDGDLFTKHWVHGAQILSNGIDFTAEADDDHTIKNVRVFYDFLIPVAGGASIPAVGYPDELTRHSYERASFVAAQEKLEVAFPQEFAALQDVLVNGRHDNLHIAVGELAYSMQANATPQLLESLEVYLTKSLDKNGPYKMLTVNGLELMSPEDEPADTENPWTKVQINGVLSELVHFPECKFIKGSDGESVLTVTVQRMQYGDADTEFLKVVWENIRLFQSQRSIGSLGSRALAGNGFLREMVTRYLGQSPESTGAETEISEPVGAILSIEKSESTIDHPEYDKMVLYDKTIREVIDIVKSRTHQLYASSEMANNASKHLIDTEIFPRFADLASITLQGLVASGEVHTARTDILQGEDDEYVVTILRTQKEQSIEELHIGEDWKGVLSGVFPGVTAVNDPKTKELQGYAAKPMLRLTQPSIHSQDHALGLLTTEHVPGAFVTLDGSSDIRVDGLEEQRVIRKSLETVQKEYSQECYDLLVHLKYMIDNDDPSQIKPIEDPKVFLNLATEMARLERKDSSPAIVDSLEAMLVGHVVTIAGDRYQYTMESGLQITEDSDAFNEITMSVEDVRTDIDPSGEVYLVVRYVNNTKEVLDYMPISAIREFGF